MPSFITYYNSKSNFKQERCLKFILNFKTLILQMI